MQCMSMSKMFTPNRQASELVDTVTPRFYCFIVRYFLYRPDTVVIVLAFTMAAPSPTAQPSSYLLGDRGIIRFLAAFGMPAVRVCARSHRLLAPMRYRYATVLAGLLYTALAVHLFKNVQLLWLYRSKHFLSSLSDTFRGLSIIYAYQLMIVLAMSRCQGIVAYFNRLATFDAAVWRRFAVRSDCERVRRSFWWHTGGIVLNYLTFSLMSSLWYYGRRSVGDALFVTVYTSTAIGMGVATVFLQYAAHSCEVRYRCVRQRLAAAVQWNHVGDISRETHNNGRKCSTADDVTAAMRFLNELDEIKEQLQQAFGALLSWKLAINGVNVIVSVYFFVYKLNNRSGHDLVRAIVDYVTYEVPFIVSDVLMVGHFQAIGDEVSGAKTPASAAFRLICVLVVALK